MTLAFYKVVHIGAAFFVMAALGESPCRRSAAPTATAPASWPVSPTGLALLAVLITGFGALAKLGGGGMRSGSGSRSPSGLVLGGMIAVVRRVPQSMVKIVWILIPPARSGLRLGGALQARLRTGLSRRRRPALRPHGRRPGGGVARLEAVAEDVGRYPGREAAAPPG